MPYLRNLCLTQGQIDFVSFLNVLYFLVLNLGVWSMLRWFFYIVQALIEDFLCFILGLWMSCCFSSIFSTELPLCLGWNCPVWNSFWILCFVDLYNLSVARKIPYSLDCCWSMTVVFKSDSVIPPILLFLRCFGYCRFYAFQYEF